MEGSAGGKVPSAGLGGSTCEGAVAAASLAVFGGRMFPSASTEGLQGRSGEGGARSTGGEAHAASRHAAARDIDALRRRMRPLRRGLDCGIEVMEALVHQCCERIARVRDRQYVRCGGRMARDAIQPGLEGGGSAFTH